MRVVVNRPGPGCWGFLHHSIQTNLALLGWCRKSLDFFLWISESLYTTMPRDLLHPSASEEAKQHKLKRLVQSPNSYFMDVKCPGCFNITTVFSHAQTVVLCGSCSVMLCQPTGGKARLTDGCQYRKKTD